MIKIVNFAIEFAAIRVEGCGEGGLAQCCEGGQRKRDQMDSWAARVIVRPGPLGLVAPARRSGLLRR
jgi:hypothetical protein